MNTHAILCNLCELPIPTTEAVHCIADSLNLYCDECWTHRADEVAILEGIEAIA